MRGRLIQTIAWLVLPGILGACRTAPPPTQMDWPGTPAALRILADRASAVDSLSAVCGIEVQNSDGTSAYLDGVMIIAKPDRMRVQGYKVLRVFDLTVRGEEMWVWADERAGDLSGRFTVTGPGGRTWLGPLLEPIDPDAAQVVMDDPQAGVLTVKFPMDTTPGTGWSWVVDIDRATITYRELRVLDPEQQVVQRLVLDDYGVFDADTSANTTEIPWPQRINATGRVTIDLRLDDLELNPDLPTQAFDPPAQAERVR